MSDNNKENKVTFWESVKAKAAEFQQKHPKLIKGLRIGCVLAAGAAIAYTGYEVGKASMLLDDSDDGSTPLLDGPDPEEITLAASEMDAVE